ncbi:GTP-binding protein gtr2 [Cryptotrichosporon argae]
MDEKMRPRADSAARPGDDARRSMVLVMGPRKAGKSSCIKTVFQHVPVKDVPYLGITQRIEKIDYDSIVPLQVWDTPAHFELEYLDVPVSAFSTLVYVIDMQQDDLYHEVARAAVPTLLKAYFANPAIHFSIFLHKAEALSEDVRVENYSEFQRVLTEELEDFRYASLEASAPPHFDLYDEQVCNAIFTHLVSEIKFDMTSVHNVWLKDAWSKVVQGVFESLPSVEQLLVSFSENSGMDNSYLFDIQSGVVMATDNRHRNDATMDQVTEYLSRFLQFRELYKELRPQSSTSTRAAPPNGAADHDAEYAEKGDESDEPAGWWDDEDPDGVWMHQATRLLPSTTISLWQITPHLALVSLLRTDTWQTRRGIIEYNLTFLRQGVRQILMEM